MAEKKSSVKLLFYAAGIFCSYFYFGILQEKITRSEYGPHKEIFSYTISLVLIQCIVNCAFARMMLATFMKQGRDRTKPTYYAMCSLTYLGAMICSNWALRHVNYPTQVVGKSCKPIPIMIFGVLLGGKRYPPLKYLFISLIVTGVAMFMYKGKSSANSSAPSLGFGEILLLSSLAMDGLTGATQEVIKRKYNSKSGHMMFAINLWSCIFLVCITLITGEWRDFISFVDRFPSTMYDIALFSLLSALGQLFIFLTVAEFGPLPCSIMTTTRKFFTVLGSVLFFGNSLSTSQWIGTSLVFIGLTMDSLYKK